MLELSIRDQSFTIVDPVHRRIPDSLVIDRNDPGQVMVGDVNSTYLKLKFQTQFLLEKVCHLNKLFQRFLASDPCSFGGLRLPIR